MRVPATTFLEQLVATTVAARPVLYGMLTASASSSAPRSWRPSAYDLREPLAPHPFKVHGAFGEGRLPAEASMVYHDKLHGLGVRLLLIILTIPSLVCARVRRQRSPYRSR